MGADAGQNVLVRGIREIWFAVVCTAVEVIDSCTCPSAFLGVGNNFLIRLGNVRIGAALSPLIRAYLNDKFGVLTTT